MDKIALITDAATEPAAFADGCRILLFGKDEEGWQVVEEIPYHVDSGFSVSEYRDFIRSVILQLSDCKIIAGKTVSGLPYSVFERMGFEMFETDFISGALLDQIIADIKESRPKETPPVPVAPTSPVLTGTEGVYFLNLLELHRQHPHISSKKALQPFLETAAFYRLEVLCSHVPPWFDLFLPKKRLTYSIADAGDNTLKITILKKVCDC